MQLRMNFDVETFIPEDSKVRLVCNIVEEMNLESILSTCRRGRKPVVDSVTMLKILLFATAKVSFPPEKSKPSASTIRVPITCCKVRKPPITPRSIAAATPFPSTLTSF